MDNLYGQFVWFQGVVEDRNDPMKLGRVRVRCIGYHTDDLELIKTEDLPWASLMMPPTSAGTSDIGQSPTGIVEGTHVVGFFADGMNAQQPVVMGTFVGIPEETANTALGFNDPNAKYPTRIDEPDTNRLARNETGSDGKPDPDFAHPILKEKIEGQEKEIAVGNNELEWEEPLTPYSAEYPNNHVKETEGGHIEEFDDTENSERYHRYHPSGNFIEEGPDGTTVRKIKGKNFEIIESDDSVLIKGVKNLRVEGNENVTVVGNKDVLVQGSIEEVVEGAVDSTVEGNVDSTISGNEDKTVEGSQNLVVNGTQTITVDGNITINSQGNISLIAGGTLTLGGATIQHIQS